jgi:hypothetical protein
MEGARRFILQNVESDLAALSHNAAVVFGKRLQELCTVAIGHHLSKNNSVIKHDFSNKTQSDRISEGKKTVIRHNISDYKRFKWTIFQ